MKYNVTIGMEIHAELKTASKMFCACKNGLGVETVPNVNICPVCTAQPGTLPVPNRKAIEAVQRVGLALSCTLRLNSKFDRKNYFYPDIPKGYQISQYDEPFCEHGVMEIEDGETKKSFRITRIHLEEDTGKSMHPTGEHFTLVDFNRAGVPLMELVTEADFSTGKDVRLFCQKLRQTLRYLDVSDADMEKGQMRCEVNISLYPDGADRLSGTKVEVKNINSFRSVERAIEYEIVRQTSVLEAGEKLVQETRGWDEAKNLTVSQRKKESAHDYRYFPEPDIPPFEFDSEYVEKLRATLPELPDAKLHRFVTEYGLPLADVVTLTDDHHLANYFEAVASELAEKVKSREVTVPFERAMKLASNYVLTELRKYFTEHGEDITNIKITPENYAEFIGIVAEGKINSSAAQTVLAEMYKGGDNDPSHIIERLNLSQMSDTSELETIVSSVLSANEKSVADYRAGKQNAFQFLIGQVMSATKGKANPKIVQELLKKKLS
ncbi:MAG: Asp-tRNA(Asn)/Glu-tRNA(Gln) amidotransferase subunit GatB [Candidatus Moranbacteria bacterium]|nr:Asp-tRNA(Asn)/Glu-tRNA(Gln) amidotransferase subunit GatB [Candidatus Moranbacteria bacterium]MDD3965376.1 Asp-tRNA(Asn)/Glu-tRNA(Gln) amidotransferase subunit GatB [Candidatus Moranbacteria bacterium]